MFRRWGLLEAARRFDGGPGNAIGEHAFRLKKLPTLGPRYQLRGFEPCRDCRDGAGWRCVVLVRSPLDRAVSSYVHVMRYDVMPRTTPLAAKTSRTSSGYPRKSQT